MEMLDYPSWRWGLSLIALNMAIHAAAVVTMGIVALKVRLRLETRVFVLWHRVRDGQTRFGPHRSGIP